MVIIQGTRNQGNLYRTEYWDVSGLVLLHTNYIIKKTETATTIEENRRSYGGDIISDDEDHVDNYKEDN